MPTDTSAGTGGCASVAPMPRAARPWGSGRFLAGLARFGTLGHRRYSLDDLSDDMVADIGLWRDRRPMRGHPRLLVRHFP